MAKATAAKRIGTGRAGRKRRLTGWTLIAVGLLVAGVWVAGRWLSVRLDRGSFGVVVHTGQVLVARYRPAVSTRTEVETSPGLPRIWWHGWNEWSGTGQTTVNRGVVSVSSYNVGGGRGYVLVKVCLWPISLLLWAAGVAVLRLGIVARRRAMTGRCGKCGYSLAGLGEGAGCPECGKGAGTT